MFNEREWSSFLSRELDCAVHVRFGQARHRVLEARPVAGRGATRKDGLDIRLSAFFAEAPADVREAVARWLRVGRRARRSSNLLDAWIAESLERLPPAAPRRTRVRPRGRHHDLDELAGKVRSKTDLDVTPWPAITWGRRTGSRARHSLQLGCFVPSDNLVRVHPVLDLEWVPDWFVRYVLFHELLHAALPATAGVDQVRTVHHGPEFRRRERRYPDYPRALAWQKKHLPALLRAARTRQIPAITEAAVAPVERASVATRRRDRAEPAGTTPARQGELAFPSW